MNPQSNPFQERINAQQQPQQQASLPPELMQIIMQFLGGQQPQSPNLQDYLNAPSAPVDSFGVNG